MPSADSKSSKEPIVITIDGPAGAGKSTVAKKLANHLNFMYLDTGAMYRALTFKALKQKIDLDDDDQLIKLVGATEIDIQKDAHQKMIVLCDQEDVTHEIRSQEVTNSTYFVARVSGVREISLYGMQAIFWIMA